MLAVERHATAFRRVPTRSHAFIRVPTLPQRLDAHSRGVISSEKRDFRFGSLSKLVLTLRQVPEFHRFVVSSVIGHDKERKQMC